MLASTHAHTYTCGMITPETPLPPAILTSAGHQWAAEHTYHDYLRTSRDTLTKLYHVGILLWQAHQATTRARVEEAGGIAKVSSVWADHYNYATLHDGSTLYAATLLQAPTLTLGTFPGKTPDTERSYHQRYQLKLAFGGRMLGGKAERSRHEINEHSFGSVDFTQLIFDQGFFPEQFALTERVTTSFDDPRPEYDRDQHYDASFSLDGLVWGPNFLGLAPAPNPHTDPLGYRAWAMQTHPMLNLNFQAPLPDNKNSGRFTPVTVINQYGSLKPDAETAYHSLMRFRQLLGYYAYTAFPGIFPEDMDIVAAIEASSQA